jgi:hypothetical protein
MREALLRVVVVVASCRGTLLDITCAIGRAGWDG